MSMVQEEQDIQIPVPELLELMLDKGASDLHLTAGAPPTIRLHGELERLEEYPVLSPRALQGMVYAILPQKFRERLEQELELDMSYALPGKARFRGNVYFQRDSIGAAFRLIPYEIKDVDSLGLPPAGKDLGGFPQHIPQGGRSQGRTEAVEILVARPADRNLIREGKTHQIFSSMQAGGRFG